MKQKKGTKRYVGRYGEWYDSVRVVVEEPDGKTVSYDLPKRFDLRNHSPDGFAWGYGGSGPSQLALAILADFLEDERDALKYYQDFKWRAVVQLPQQDNWTITATQVRDILNEIIAGHGEPVAKGR